MNFDALVKLKRSGDIVGPEKAALALFGPRYINASEKVKMEMRWDAEAIYNSLPASVAR